VLKISIALTCIHRVCRNTHGLHRIPEDRLLWREMFIYYYRVLSDRLHYYYSGTAWPNCSLVLCG